LILNKVERYANASTSSGFFLCFDSR